MSAVVALGPFAFPSRDAYKNDWTVFFRPATLAILHGDSPYQVQGFHNPPWLLIPLVPLALLPAAIGNFLIGQAYVASFFVVSRKFGAPRWLSIALVCSPFVLVGVLMGQMDWLPALGLLMPPWLGILFLLAKPQVGVGVVVFWLIQAWADGWRALTRTLGPAAILCAVSFVLYGFWPPAMFKAVGYFWNASLWPWSIPAGAGFLVWSIRRNRIGGAIIAGPLLSPYVSPISWVLPLMLGSIWAVSRRPDFKPA